VSAVRCSDASREAGEPLAGTATTVERWLLVEVAGTWPRDVGDASPLGEPAATAVKEWIGREPSSRLLFLRRPGRRAGRISAYVVSASASRSEVRFFELDGHAQLADVDLDAEGARIDEPLVLVCGHGSRDACCALLGTPVYGALAGLGSDHVWLSSHQGGHRFAANVLVLPAGIQLGRIAPEEAARVVGEVLAGRIDLDRYRGRTYLDPVGQAAEIATRQALGLHGPDDLRVVDQDGGQVRLEAADGTRHEVVVEEGDGPVLPASCGAAAELQPVLHARLL
jgi:hypothetical protein